MSWLSVVTGVLSVLVAIYRQFWSDSAQLKKLELRLVALQSKQSVEAERLQATYGRIDHEPDTTGDQLAKDLNDANARLRE